MGKNVGALGLQVPGPSITTTGGGEMKFHLSGSQPYILSIKINALKTREAMEARCLKDRTSLSSLDATSKIARTIMFQQTTDVKGSQTTAFRLLQGL